MTCNREVIRLENIYTSYEGAQHPVLRDVSLSISAGEFVVVGGPNGAGKTTLIESINGMLRITHGTACVCGCDVMRNGVNIRKKAGYVIQNFFFDSLVPFTTEQVVMMGRYGLLGFFRRPSETDYRVVERAMHLLGIEDLAGRPIGMLSGGQQQKVLIAQNIAKEPEIMLLDEPFSNLDLHSREFISDVFGKLAEQGMTIMLVSHAFDGLPDTAIRTLVMNEGRITFDAACHADDVEQHVREASVVQ